MFWNVYMLNKFQFFWSFWFNKKLVFSFQQHLHFFRLFFGENLPSKKDLGFFSLKKYLKTFQKILEFSENYLGIFLSIFLHGEGEKNWSKNHLALILKQSANEPSYKIRARWFSDQFFHWFAFPNPFYFSSFHQFTRTS